MTNSQPRIPNFDSLVIDCQEHILELCERNKIPVEAREILFDAFFRNFVDEQNKHVFAMAKQEMSPKDCLDNIYADAMIMLTFAYALGQLNRNKERVN